MSSMIFAAFQLGFVYSLLSGPILIASSQCVVTGGWRRGCWFLLGVTLADAIYIAIIYWGLSTGHNDFGSDNSLYTVLMADPSALLP
jgi:threonine/homoserine/homoserine lactone efflux protein